MTKKLDKLIELLENLPERICNEMGERAEIRKKLHIEEIQSNLDFYHNNINELNKMMYGYSPVKENKVP